ncbi:MAG: GntR family transcriptional regulator, partial [Chloroflexota bacterium]
MGDEERTGQIPIHRQVSDRLAAAIKRGDYPPGTRLP